MCPRFRNTSGGHRRRRKPTMFPELLRGAHPQLSAVQAAAFRRFSGGPRWRVRSKRSAPGDKISVISGVSVHGFRRSPANVAPAGPFFLQCFPGHASKMLAMRKLVRAFPGQLRGLAWAVAGVGMVSVFSIAGAAQIPQAQPVRELNAVTIYKQHCAACHGVDGKGNGPAAPALKAKVPDLTRISKNAGGKFPRQRIRQVIEGAEPVVAHGTREMPVWGPLLHEIEGDQDLGNVRVDNLLHYLESMQQK